MITTTEPRGTRITSKGQVTIPKHVRDRMGVKPGDEVIFVEDEGGFRIRRRIRREDIAKWRGFLKDLAGRDVDELISEMRDG